MSYSSPTLGSSSTSTQLQVGALVLASLVVGAASWRASSGVNGGWFGSSKKDGWRATNLRDLRQFEVEEVLSDEAAPAPDGYTVFLGRFAWQVRVHLRRVRSHPGLA